jgi:hypothetical protein
VGKLPFILGGFIVQLARRGSGKNKLFIFGLGEVYWALWKVRNKMAIENVMIKSPVTIMFNVISFLQQWSLLLLAKEKCWGPLNYSRRN